MRARDSKRLVIDADVARASGSETTTHPRAEHCRDFLNAVLSLSHRIVMTEKINNEWKNHQSRFARRWRVSMDARKRINRIDPPEDEELQAKVTTTTNDADEIEALRKDFHLLQAALVTDQTIISLDETIRGLFKQASQQVGEIRNIIWVNPDRTTEEQPITWLQNGASPEPHRQLSA
ncbi:hypothetical protein C6503_20870 [Candidatus Poribacteria bacterium]|nr:MAG: hypothetical protein C6503_20870 [Candidatus Poribacteria bacterium]